MGGFEYPGVQDVVIDSINKCDLDLRQSLYTNIVLSGGSTLTKGSMMFVSCGGAGFGDRLLMEMKRVALKGIKIKIFAPPERKYSTWIGGSILASLGTFST